jgi:hypothetical protein
VTEFLVSLHKLHEMYNFCAAVSINRVAQKERMFFKYYNPFQKHALFLLPIFKKHALFLLPI